MSARTELLEAAKDLLWERGYEAMSPRAVLDKSGAGQGSLYHHFNSKANLAATALAEVSEEMLEDFLAYFRSDKPPLDRVRDFLRQPRQALKGCRLGRLSQEQAIADPALREPVTGYFRAVLDELEKALSEAQQEGSIDPARPAGELATCLMATIQGGYVLSRVFQDPAQMERAVSGALAFIDTLERNP